MNRSDCSLIILDRLASLKKMFHLGNSKPLRPSLTSNEGGLKVYDETYILDLPDVSSAVFTQTLKRITPQTLILVSSSHVPRRLASAPSRGSAYSPYEAASVESTCVTCAILYVPQEKNPLRWMTPPFSCLMPDMSPLYFSLQEVMLVIFDTYRPLLRLRFCLIVAKSFSLHCPTIF